MEKVLCVDLSEYQRGIDFGALRNAGVKGVILRGGDGSYIDKCFAQFYEQAKQAGLPAGAYWFSRALTVSEARAEAERFYDRCLKGRQFELPIYLDCEAEKQRKLGKRGLTDVILAWSGYLLERGFLCGVYSTAEWFREYMDWSELSHLERWVAQWSSREPSISYGMWQFGGETNYIRDKHIAGYVVDQNYMVKNYPEIVKKNGYNGYPKPEPEEAEKEEETMEKRYQTVAEAPEWARPELQALIDAGALRGDEKGRLNLSDDMLRTMIVCKRYADKQTGGTSC